MCHIHDPIGPWIFAILLLPGMIAGAQDLSLKIVRPTTGENLTITKGSTFVIGTVSPSTAKVTVNAVAAEVSQDGAFLAFAPIEALSKPQSIQLADGKRKPVDAALEVVANAGGKEARQQILVATSTTQKIAEPAAKVFDKPVPYRVAEEQILSRTATNDWGLLYLPAGAYVESDARRGKRVRLRLADTGETWVEEQRLKPLRERIRITKLLPTNNQPNEFRIGIEAVVPYTIVCSQAWLRVTLHVPDHPAHLNFMAPASRFWGFAARYEATNLVITVRSPPDLSTGLRGKVICLDPGHNPDPGAIGPRGFEEREANLKIGLALEKFLVEAGAKVAFTHRNEPLPLLRRSAAAVKHNPDILVSLHNNSVPDGTDPRTNYGTSTYYYHPQSKPLADALHAAMLRGLGFPDLKVNQKSLFVCRISEFPAVLVEPAFIILPDQEKLLKTEAGQQKIAKAIFEGIKDFFEACRAAN